MPMRRLSFTICLLLAQSSWAAAPTVDINKLTPHSTHEIATSLITEVMEKLHYKKIQLDDALSRKILDRYLENLDPNRNIFLKSDILRFSQYKTTLDDSIKNSNLNPAFEIFKVYRKRLKERTNYANSLLKKNFNFKVKEEYLFDRRDEPWPSSRKEINQIWRHRVKNDILSLKLLGKKNKEIRKTLGKRYTRLMRSTSQLKAEDVYQLFINSYTHSVEPHTAYFSPRVSEDFKINMSLSLEGIGAALKTENDYTIVQKVIKGGPADLSGLIHSEDKIIGVAQGRHGNFVDVIGWRLSDVVDLIRGPKGSTVRLQLLTKDTGPEGPATAITLIRNKIKLEEQAAKESIITIGEGRNKLKIGVIDLPTFYLDFDAKDRGEKDYRSTTRDVRKLLVKLMRKGVHGVIIDLRGNGGGSLYEVTNLTGLFIKTGPIVQVKDSSGQIEINRDDDPEVLYGGPLAVLVDRNSASASEIFAGAIQDYGRGIIIGEPTFGKGTVQTLIPLNRFIKTPVGTLGQLKITMAQFFRINGDSTQFRGVVPDIIFPTSHANEKHGERELDNALPWAKIKAANFVKQNVHRTSIFKINRLHKQRIASNVGFKVILEKLAKSEEFNNKRSVSLLESERVKEQKINKEIQDKHRKNIRVALGLSPEPKKKAKKHSEEEDIEDASKILLLEAVNILGDYIDITKNNYVRTKSERSRVIFN